MCINFRILPLIVSGLVTIAAVPIFAQMPVSLMDNDPVNTDVQWQQVAPVIQAVLECVQRPDPRDSVLPMLAAQRREIVPPQGFTVYGMPVQRITVTAQADAWEADLAVPLVMAEKVLRHKKTAGQLTLSAGVSRIRCTWHH